MNKLRARIKALPSVHMKQEVKRLTALSVGGAAAPDDCVSRADVLAALPAPADEKERHEPHPFAESCAHPSHDDAADIHQAATGGPDFTVKDWPLAASAPPARPDRGIANDGDDPASDRQPAPADEEERLHPGEPHDFRTACRRCGEPGLIHLSLVTPNERVIIEPVATAEAGNE